VPVGEAQLGGGAVHELGALEEADPDADVAHGAAEGARVAADGAAHRAGDVDRELEARERVLARRLHHLAQVRSRAGHDVGAVHAEVLDPVHDHEAAEAGVADEEIAPAADQEPAHAALHCFPHDLLQGPFGVGLHQDIGGAADAERRVRGDGL